jgi:peptidoglycan/LPS O-acetylase OafA/YrhL
MLTASVVLFMYAALTGLVMAVGIFKGAKRWMPLSLGHGALAATALVLALLTSLATGVAAIEYGVAVLFLAALGGLLLLSYHLRGKPHPWVVVVLHALLAVGGVGCLVFALLQ